MTVDPALKSHIVYWVVSRWEPAMCFFERRTEPPLPFVDFRAMFSLRFELDTCFRRVCHEVSNTKRSWITRAKFGSRMFCPMISRRRNSPIAFASAFSDLKA